MALFVLSLCPFDISVGIGAFVIGLGQISFFLSLDFDTNKCHENTQVMLECVYSRIIMYKRF